MSQEEATVLELIWSHFKQHGDWPKKTLLWLQLQNMDVDLEAFAERVTWVELGRESVSVRLEALLEIREVRAALEPLPRLLKLLVERFLEQPDLEDASPRGPKVTASEFFSLWGDETRAQLAAKLLQQYATWATGMEGSADSEFFFQPQLRILRYEHVESLEQYLELSDPPDRVPVTQAPTGAHLELLKAVYSSIQETKKWPKLVEFSIKHRDTLGYVPDLVTELSPFFIRQRSGDDRPPRIRLKARALPYVADKTGCALALRIVDAAVNLAIVAPKKTFTLEQIADSLKLPVEQVRPVAMLLENEPWGTTFNSWSEDQEGWRVLVHEYAVWRYKGVRTWTWEQYMTLGEQLAPEILPPVYSSKKKRSPQPATPTSIAHAEVDAAVLMAAQRLVWIPGADSREELLPKEGTEETTSDRERKSPLIFISHRSTDAELARKLFDLFRAAFHLRRDEIRCTSVSGAKLPSGADAPDVLALEIAHCKVFVALLTKQSVESSFVLFELGARWGMRKRIFPLLGPGADSNLLPPPIRDQHATSLTNEGDVLHVLADMEKDLGLPLERPHQYNEELRALLAFQPSP